MKTSINALILSLAVASTSFSAFADKEEEKYQHYTFTYQFNQKIDLVLTHYLQIKQEMEAQISRDINQQTIGFFSRFEQHPAQQLATTSLGLRDPLSESQQEQTEVR